MKNRKIRKKAQEIYEECVTLREEVCALTDKDPHFNIIEVAQLVNRIKALTNQEIILSSLLPENIL